MKHSLAYAVLDLSLGVAATLLSLLMITLTLRYRRAAKFFGNRFRSLVDAVPEYAIFMLDAGGRVVSWNAGARRIMGYSDEEIVGKHFSAFFTGEDVDQEKPDEELRMAVARGRLEQAGWHLRKDGSRFWAEVAIASTLDGKGRVTGFSKVIRDSTERKLAQDALTASAAELDRRIQERSSELLETNRVLRQEVERRSQTETSLRQSEAVVRGMFETAVDAILTIDTRGLITSSNPAAERLFGYAASEILGQNVHILMPQPYQREHDSYLARYLGTNERRIIGIGREVVGKRKDGTTFPMDLAVGEQLAGEQRMFTGFIRDLTDRKRLEAEVLDIAEREQQRIGQDLHDGLGQELTGIAFLAKGLAGRLAARKIPESAEVERINDLVNKAVSHTRALSHGLQPLDDAGGLAVALEQLCGSVQEVFCIDCTVNVENGVFPGNLTQATHLYRIAQEAVNNAIRHGKAKYVAITLDRSDRQLRLMIQDDGGGFGPMAGSGIGLRTMQYRAQSIGAALEIRPGNSAGVVVTCRLELPADSVESSA